MFRVLVSGTFRKEFDKCSQTYQKRIREALAQLENDPFTPRPQADILPLKGTHPLKYRTRVGNFRIVYTIEGREVRVIEIFRRDRGY